MAFIELLWKARTIEKYRLRYEREKQNSIRLINAQNPKKTFYQRLVNYNVTAKDRISKTILKRYPKGSNMYNLCYYLKTDQTFPNFLLKSVIGFVGGIILTYLCFMFFVFQLSISLIHATIMSSIIGVLLTLGLAFSYRVRCLVFLLLPQFFSRVGRYTLTCYALVLILTGPATNTLKNSEVLSESLACGEEQIKTSISQLNLMKMKKPFGPVKGTINVLMDDIKALAEKMKRIVLRMNRLILSLAYSIQSSLNWLAASSDKCNKNLGTPYQRCQNAIKDSIVQCQALLGPLFHRICDFAIVNEVACLPVMPIQFFCNVVEFTNGHFIETVTDRLNTFTERLNSIFYVDVHVHHFIAATRNTSRFPNQVPPGLVTEIRNKADLFLTWISWSSTVTSASLLLIIFRAKYYQHMYETRSRFDNRYITRELRDLDLKRLRQGKETVLPLNKREEGKYIKTTSFRLVSSEKIHISRSAVTMAITTFKLMIHMVADYSLYWVLMTIRSHGIKQTPCRPGNSDSFFFVSGSGLLSKIYRSLLESIAALLKAPPVSPITCLPDPHPPDFQRYTQIGVLIFLLWFFALFEPYGLRLRHVIMGHYRPERAKARAVWLYNHIQRTRGCFLKFARRKLHREYKYCSEEKHTLRRWLDDKIHCTWLKNLLGIYPHDLHCFLCGVIENCNACDGELLRCKTPTCPGTFCVKCFHDLGELCTICLSPVDYGDQSDVSLEKGSSNESDSESDGNNSKPQCHPREPTYKSITKEKKENTKSSKKIEKKKSRWLFKGNEEFDQDKDQDQITKSRNEQVHINYDLINNISEDNLVMLKHEEYMRKADVARHKKLVKIDLEKKLKKDYVTTQQDVFCTICSKYCRRHQFTGNINKIMINSEKVENDRQTINDKTLDNSLETVHSSEAAHTLCRTRSDSTKSSTNSDETVQRLIRHFGKLRKYSVKRKQLDRKLSGLSCSITTISSSFWNQFKPHQSVGMRDCKGKANQKQKESIMKKKLRHSKANSKNRRVQFYESPSNPLKKPAAFYGGKKSRVNFKQKRRIPKYLRTRKMRCIETNNIKSKASLLAFKICSKILKPCIVKTPKTSRLNRRYINKMSQGDHPQTANDLIIKKAKEDLTPRKNKRNNNQSPFPEKTEDAFSVNITDTHNRPRNRLFKRCSSFILSRVCSSLQRTFSCVHRDEVTDENSTTNHKRRKKIRKCKTKPDEKATARAYRISTYLSDLDWVKKRYKKSESAVIKKTRTKIGAELIEDFITAEEGNKVFFENEGNQESPAQIDKAEKRKKKLMLREERNLGTQTNYETSSSSTETVIANVNYESGLSDNNEAKDLDAEGEKLIDDFEKFKIALKKSKISSKKGKVKEKKKSDNKKKGKGHAKIKKSKEKKKKKKPVKQKSVTMNECSMDVEDPKSTKPRGNFWRRLFSKKEKLIPAAHADAEITVKPVIMSCACQASKYYDGCHGKQSMPIAKLDKEVTATQLDTPRKKKHRNVCTYHKCKDCLRGHTRTFFDVSEIAEQEIGQTNYSDYNSDYIREEKKKRHAMRCKMLEKHLKIIATNRSTQTTYSERKTAEVQCNALSQLKSSTPKANKTINHAKGDLKRQHLSDIQHNKGKNSSQSSDQMKVITGSLTSLDRCPSLSSIFSDEGTKSDTSVYSVIVSYADDGHKKPKKKRPVRTNVITKSNQATSTETKILCDVSTATSDWWSPIMDRKHNRAFSPKKREGRENKRNVGVYTKIMDTRGVCTANKVVTFKSHTQLIPPQPSNILSPSRYLLESQRYYNELFSDRNFSNPVEDLICERKILSPSRRTISPIKRRGSKAKRLEETQVSRRRLKNPYIMENVWTASESSHKQFAIEKTDLALAKYRSSRKHIATAISKHRHQGPVDEKPGTFRVKVRKGEVNMCTGPFLSKDETGGTSPRTGTSGEVKGRPLPSSGTV